MVVSQRPDIVRQLLPKSSLDALRRLRIRADRRLEKSRYGEIGEAISHLPALSDLTGQPVFDASGAEVIVGDQANVTESQREQIARVLEMLHPWRKGPFRLFDMEIDAEWCSNLKWDRVLPALGDLRSRKILDVGCGNGYYMFRAAHHDPEVVVGVDPSIPFFFAFELFQRYIDDPRLHYERMGAEEADLLEQCFDIALCMGVVYHRISPLEVLKKLRSTLRVGGMAIIESQTIPGAGSSALFPAERYAKARNVYFVPTRDCLVNWVRRAGFKQVEVVAHTPVTIEEQRSTQWMRFESLADFLDPDDPSKTVEGYPAPWRTVVRGVRQFL